MLSVFTILSMLAQTDDPFPERYSEGFEASHGIRQEQFDQIAGYVERLAEQSDETRANGLKLDYSDQDAYARSLEPLRKRVCERIGFPPPLVETDAKPRWEEVAKDGYATIYRMWYEVLEGVDVYGILSVPHGLEAKAPLLICQHGGGGCPEVIAPFTGDNGDGTFNYGWMVQRALKRGYVTWAPALIFPRAGVEKIEGPSRIELDKRAKRVGTSILAIELWKIQRGLDVVLERPEVDAERVGMMGLSYGGLYTQWATALDPRIKVAVSSCYFNKRKQYSWDDWSFFNYLNEFTDPEICALICPRPLMVEVGDKDELFDVASARAEAEVAGKHWERLGVPERFRFVEFEGVHEFWGGEAYEFVEPFLKP